VTLGLRPAPAMTTAELRRWLAGRTDWEEDRWQDHCGDLECGQCHGDIPGGNARAAAIRQRWEGL